MKRLAFIFTTLLVTITALAQVPTYRTHISFEFGYQAPSSDMNDRFGNNFNLGSQFEVLQTKSLWHAGFKFYFLFGSTVKEDVLSNLRTTEGFIIGNDRAPALVSLRERGFFLGPYIGKIFNLGERHPHSGIKISVGAGLLQHKIRIQDDTKTISQLTGEYRKGYDRLTNGLAGYGFLGYQHLDIEGSINFFAGFDITIASTQNRRDWNFDEGRKDDTKRLDTLLGFRVGWILPITRGEDPSNISY